MENTKLNAEKNCIIVRRVNVTDTLRNIPHGKRIHFTRRELGNRDCSVLSAISRLNQKAQSREYSLRIDDEDGSFWVTRK